MKKRVLRLLGLYALFLLSVGLSFWPIPQQVATLLYLLSLGFVIFALAVSFTLSLAIEPLREAKTFLHIALAVVLVVSGPFTIRLWSEFAWWAPLWVLASGLMLFQFKPKAQSIPNIVLTLGAMVIAFFPQFDWIAVAIMTIDALLYVAMPITHEERYYALFIASYSALYCISKIPGYEGARAGLFIPMFVLAWGSLEPQILHLRRNRIENDAIMQSEMRLTQIEEKALKAEIRPHFLLNALNNVRVAYHENGEEGRKLLNELIELETLIAEASKRDFIPISEEIEIIRGLIQLFSLERKKEIALVIDVKDKDLLIPPMLLEPLVENSLQHSGIMSQEDGEVLIQEYVDFGYAMITVADNGQGQPLPSHSRGIGLSNVVRRIELLDQGHMNISSDDQGTSIEIRFRVNGD